MYNSLFLLTTIILIIILIYNWKRRHLYLAATQYHGPKALPLVGNGLYFLCDINQLHNRIHKLFQNYNFPMRFWLGPELILCFSNTQHIEKILKSSKFSNKGELYKFMKPIGGEGLITAIGGLLYKTHRKVIQPMINLKWCESTLDIYQRHIVECTNKLGYFVDKGTVDINKTLHCCFSDIISEVVLGFDLNSQNGENLQYIEAYTKMYDVIFPRMTKPWWQLDFIYNLSRYKKDYDRCVYFTRDLIRKATDEPKKFDSEFEPLITQIQKYRDDNPGVINDEDFVSHMVTLYSASEDTMTAITAALCVCFGMYPKYQKIAYDEIKHHFFNIDNLTINNLNKLEYLDMCLKEALRIVPIAGVIMRQVLEDSQIDKWTIPKGSSVLVPIFELHYDPKYWTNPQHFHPDHFLPEEVRKRDPYAFLPFSAGVRNCIGKFLANSGLKLMMANILREFEIEADGTLPDIELKSDVSVRFTNGYNVRFKRRIT